MKYSEIIRLHENKDSYIDKNPNLTDTQKAEVKEFFHTHPEQENKISSKMWQAKTAETMPKYEDFKKVIREFNKRYLPKLTLKDLKEGRDYVVIDEDEWTKTYFVKTYRASVAFASNNIGPEVWCTLPDWYTEADGFSKNVIQDYEVSTNPEYYNPDLPEDNVYSGAKWCISMNHTSKYWDDYEKAGYYFVFRIQKNSNTTMFNFFDSGDNKYAYAIKNGEVISFYTAFDEEITAEDAEGFDDAEFIEVLENNSLLLNEIEKEEERKIEEAREKARIRKQYKESLPQIIVNDGYHDIPCVQMGSRKEGKVFGSTLCLSYRINYFLGNYKDDVNPYWTDSTIRQWLNSDEPNGQWWKPNVIFNTGVHLEKVTPPKIDGFLRLAGIDKSQLNLVTNKTFTGEEYETTEDYVWIPSLSELCVESDNPEGEPLEYWKMIKKNCFNSAFEKEELICYNPWQSQSKVEGSFYWLRSRAYYNYFSGSALSLIGDSGYLSDSRSWGNAFVRILFSPKESLIEQLKVQK